MDTVIEIAQEMVNFAIEFALEHTWFTRIFIALALMQIWYFWCSLPRKVFDKKSKTVIMITGGAQGLGSLMTAKFMKESEHGSVEIVVVDIREDLVPQLKESV